MTNTTRSRLQRCAAILVLCLPLQSCFTAGLWSTGMQDSQKLSLTPLALALDAVTLPAQLAVLGHDDHGGHGRRRHHRSHRHCR